MKIQHRLQIKSIHRMKQGIEYAIESVSTEILEKGVEQYKFQN